MAVVALADEKLCRQKRSNMKGANDNGSEKRRLQEIIETSEDEGISGKMNNSMDGMNSDEQQHVGRMVRACSSCEPGLSNETVLGSD
jgi:hypothetical protein